MPEYNELTHLKTRVPVIGQPNWGTHLNTSLANIDAAASFSVMAYGATGDGSTDDATAIQAAVDAASAAGGGVVFFPFGTYIVKSSINLASKVHLVGAGWQSSIIKCGTTFAGSGSRGLVQMTGTGTYSHVRIADLGFDTTQGVANVLSIYQHNGSVQHFVGERLWFENGAAGNGFLFEGLGSTSTASFNLTFRDIVGHNGGGDILLYLNAASASGLYRDVTIENVYSFIDTNGVPDDRILIAGNFASGNGSSLAEVRDVSIRNVRVEVASTVTSGTIHGIKLDPGSSSYIHNVSIRDTYMRGNTSLTSNSPIICQVGSNGSKIQDILVDGVFAYLTGAIVMRVMRQNNAPSLTLRNIVMQNCWNATAFIEIYTPDTASGDEQLLIDGVTLDGNGQGGGSFPVGIMLTSSGTGAGWTGSTQIRNVTFQQIATGISNNLTEAQATVVSTWTNVYIDNCNFVGATTKISQASGTRFVIKDNPGTNPIGSVVVSVPASGVAVAAVSYDRTFYVTADAGGGVTMTIQGGPGVVIPASAVVPVFVPAGQTVTPTYTNAPTWVVEGE